MAASLRGYRGAWHEVLTMPQTAYFGALVQSALRLYTYESAWERLENVIGVILPDH
jgi:hypothetical protein